MEFRSLFRLNPPSMFGLPEEDHTVIPSGPQQILGDVIHAPTGIHVGYGAMSVYRPAHQAVTESLSIRSLDCQLRDNVLTVNVDAESHSEAYAIARSAVDRFTSQLSLDTGQYCNADALFVEGGDGHWRPPRLMLLSRVAGYDLVELSAGMQEAAAACSTGDERLVVGCRYLQHARWLFELTAVSTDPDDVNTRMLASSIFLNLYKAASAAVGDPSMDRDYQRRFTELGFDREYFETRLEALRRLRNSYDVAHYRLDPVDPERLHAEVGISFATASEVLMALRRASTSSG